MQKFGKEASQAFLFSFGEVQAGEFAVILLCGGVVGFCSFYFAVETAEPETPTFESDVGYPSAGVFFEGDADVAGGGFGFEFRPIACVLRVSGEAEVILPVVEAVAVFVVDDLAFGGVEDLAVHINQAVEAALWGQTDGLVGGGVVRIFLCEPCVFTNFVEPARVNAGVFADVEGDAAKGIAVPQPSAEHQRRCEDPVKRIWNRESEVVCRQLINDY